MSTTRNMSTELAAWRALSDGERHRATDDLDAAFREEAFHFEKNRLHEGEVDGRPAFTIAAALLRAAAEPEAPHPDCHCKCCPVCAVHPKAEPEAKDWLDEPLTEEEREKAERAVKKGGDPW